MIIINQKDDGTGGLNDENGNELFNVNYVETASTAANLKAYGLTQLTSTAAKSYTIDAPFLGAHKEIVNTAGSTTINTVTFGSTVNGISVGGSSVARKITFNGQNDAVTLTGISTSKWLVTSNNSATIATS